MLANDIDKIFFTHIWHIEQSRLSIPVEPLTLIILEHNPLKMVRAEEDIFVAKESCFVPTQNNRPASSLV